MARKQPPPGFDPHPGDPWHPDWSLSDEKSPKKSEPADPDALVSEQGGDADWWQRALARQDDTGEPAQVPEAYASLESAVRAGPDVASDTPEPAEPVRGSWWKRRFGRAPKADSPGEQSDVPVAAEQHPELELQEAAEAEAEAVLAEAEAEAEFEAEAESEPIADSEAEVVAEPVSGLDSAAVPVPEPRPEEVAEPIAGLEPEVTALVEHLVEDLSLEAEVVEGRRPDVDVELVAESELDVDPASDIGPEPVIDDVVIEDLVSKLGSEPAVIEGKGVDLDEAAVLEPALDPEVAGLVEHLVEDLSLEAEVVEGRRPDVDVELVAGSGSEPDLSLDAEPAVVPEAAVIENLLSEWGSKAAVVEDAGTDPAGQDLIAEPEPHPDPDLKPASAAELAALVEDVVSDLEHDEAVGADIEPESVAAEEPEPEPESEFVEVDEGRASEPEGEVVAVEEERELEGVVGFELGSVVVADIEPEPELVEVDVEPEPDEGLLATKAADRVYRIASSIAAEDSLRAADTAHQEDARMRAAIAEVREKHEVRLEGAADLEARHAERMAVREALAAEVRRIEAARQEVEESVRRTAAEVRSTLEGHRQRTEESSPAPQRPINDIGAVFAAMAADQKAYDDADLQRMERREQLRLRTSLLVVDADQPWAAQGWSRPGSSLGDVPPAGSEVVPAAATPVVTSFEPIDTASAPTVPESAPRRRWSWSRRRTPPTSPNTPQNTMRHVVVVKEKSVTGREDEPGADGQDALPFDDAASPVPETNGDLEDLAAWSDMDWGFETGLIDPADESPAGLDSPDSGLFSDDSADSPDADSRDADSREADSREADSRDADSRDADSRDADSRDADSPDDDSPDAESPDTWESFTADDYVQTATHEYADLAAAVAAAETEEPELAALSADMPGLESSLVSLDDVVAAEGMARAAAAPDRSDLAIRVLTAIGLVVLFFASLTYQWSIRLLVLVVMTVAAGELATSLTRRGHHPVGLFSYLGTIGALVGAWIYGPVAIPVAVAVTILVVVLFFGLVTGRQDPLVGMALTVVIVMWVGVFGAFAYDLIEASEYRWLIATLVLIVAGMDVAAYFVGKRLGKRLLAPVVSPKKTVAGLVGGVVAAVGIGVGLSFIPAAPFEWHQGLVLGAALAVTGPLGDLAVSVLKRAMQVKDMGTILPGHGGVVDRIDAILFSIPAAWAVYAWAGLLV